MEEKTIVNKDESGEISLKELILKILIWYRYLLSKWIIVFVLSVAGCGLGIVYAILKKPVYTAITTFVLEDGEKGGGLGQYGAIASMAGFDIGGGGGGIFQGDNILELYKSRNIIEKTLLTKVIVNSREKLLVDMYMDFNNLNKVEGTSAIKRVDFSVKNIGLNEKSRRLRDSILGGIVNDINKNNLFVSKPDKKLNIIEAKVISTDELFAKVFNEKIVENVNDFYVRTKTKKSLENVSILQQKVDSVRSVMNGSILKAANIADATPNLNLTHQAQRTAPVQRAQFSVEINKLVLSELVKNLELSKISLRKEMPLIQVVDEPVFPLLKSNYGKVKFAVIGGICMMIFSVVLLILKRITAEIMGKDKF